MLMNIFHTHVHKMQNVYETSRHKNLEKHLEHET